MKGAFLFLVGLSQATTCPSYDYPLTIGDEGYFLCMDFDLENEFAYFLGKG
jgi:hypothetical protein